GYDSLTKHFDLGESGEMVLELEPQRRRSTSTSTSISSPSSSSAPAPAPSPKRDPRSPHAHDPAVDHDLPRRQAVRPDSDQAHADTRSPRHTAGRSGSAHAQDPHARRDGRPAKQSVIHLRRLNLYCSTR